MHLWQCTGVFELHFDVFSVCLKTCFSVFPSPAPPPPSFSFSSLHCAVFTDEGRGFQIQPGVRLHCARLHHNHPKPATLCQVREQIFNKMHFKMHNLLILHVSQLLHLQCKIRTSLTLLVASKTLGTNFYVGVAPKSNGYTVYVCSWVPCFNTSLLVPTSPVNKRDWSSETWNAVRASLGHHQGWEPKVSFFLFTNVKSIFFCAFGRMTNLFELYLHKL